MPRTSICPIFTLLKANMFLNFSWPIGDCLKKWICTMLLYFHGLKSSISTKVEGCLYVDRGNLFYQTSENSFLNVCLLTLVIQYAHYPFRGEHTQFWYSTRNTKFCNKSRSGWCYHQKKIMDQVNWNSNDEITFWSIRSRVQTLLSSD